MENTPTRRTLLKASLAGVTGAAAAAGLGATPVASASTSGGHRAESSRRAEWTRRIDEIIAPITTPRGLGVTVAVHKRDRAVFVKGYGLRDRGLPETFTGEDFFEVEQLDDLLHLNRGKRATTFDTNYNLGSISKGFTAAAVLLLQERGKLTVDDRLGTYLPAYTRGSDVTLLQLMHQVSGIPDFNNFPLSDQAYADFVASGEKDFSSVLTTLDSLPLAFPPGSQYAYSNSNFLLLGLVVEKVARTDLGRFLQRHVFGPLRMRDTRHGYPAKGSTDVALGYQALADDVARAYQWNMPWLTGAGSLSGTARDLGRWQWALQRPGLLSRSSLRTMFTPLLDEYGCGWVVTTHDDRPYHWHNGGMGGFRTMNAIFPDQEISVTLLSNDDTATPAVERSAPQVFDAVREIW